MQEACTI